MTEKSVPTFDGFNSKRMSVTAAVRKRSHISDDMSHIINPSVLSKGNSFIE